MHFLIVEGRPEKREILVSHLLHYLPDLQLTEATNAEEFQRALEGEPLDLVLTDYALGWAGGLEILRQVQRRFPTVPVVMFAETGDEDIAAQGMRMGLGDYLLLDGLERLPAAIQSSLHRARLQKELDRARQELQERRGALEARVQERTEELQQQATEMETQAEEFEVQTEELRQQTDELNFQTQELAEERARLQTIIQYAPYAIIVADAQARVVLANPVAERISAWPVPLGQDYENQAALQLCYPDDTPYNPRDLPLTRSALDGESFFDVEMAIFWPDGQRRDLLVSSVPIRDAHGRVTGAVAMFQDITERKQAEQDRERLLAEVEQAHCLSETLNRINTLLSSSLDIEAALPQVLIEAAQGLQVEAGIISRWDGKHWKMQYGYGVPPTLLGREFTDTEAESWVRAARDRQVLVVEDTQENSLMNSEAVRAYGMRSLLVIPLIQKEQVVGVMSFASRSNPAAFGPAQVDFGWKLATALSLTLENVHLYEQAQKDAEMRATLLREVNHRVKNNLAAIIGLLYAHLESPALANQPEYETAIREVVRQIEGLSIVHGMLSAVQWAPLRLAELAERIVGTTLQAAPVGQMSVEVQPSDVRVSPDQAHALALIISELALNVSKHLLQEGASIRVVISATQEDGNVLLTFRDNGPGYPEEVLAKQSAGVGLGLTCSLVRQNLRGQMVLRNEAGAVAEIRFPLAKAGNDGKVARRR